MPGQIGLEPTPEAYCQRMVEVFREVSRVLRDDGCLWLNVGDSYAAVFEGGKGRKAGTVPYNAVNEVDKPSRSIPPGLKPKDLVGVPWRLAFALQADGWYLRSDIVWHKPNPMPESVTDRPTKSHEYVFLLTKRERYYYDQEAVREAARYVGRIVDHEQPSTHLNPTYRAHSGGYPNANSGRNLRDVWTIPTEPCAEAHFATMPTALVEPCIKAGTSERGCCPQCGAPWQRVVEKEKVGDNTHLRHDNPRAGIRGSGLCRPPKTKAASQELGWTPTCKCDAGDPQPCVVLDPFFGAGTVGLVSERLGRSYIGIELNPEYAAIARRRIATNGKAKVVPPDPEDQGRLFGEEETA